MLGEGGAPAEEDDDAPPGEEEIYQLVKETFDAKEITES